MEKGIVLTPDLGSIKLARSYAQQLNWDLAIVDKRRINAEHVEMTTLIGDVKGKDVLIVDDMCSTGETLKIASDVCKQAGARRIFAAVTHGLFVGPTFWESAIEKILVSNTISMPSDVKRERIEVVSVASLFGKAIDSIVSAKSISSLFA